MRPRRALQLGDEVVLLEVRGDVLDEEVDVSLVEGGLRRPLLGPHLRLLHRVGVRGHVLHEDDLRPLGDGVATVVDAVAAEAPPPDVVAEGRGDLRLELGEPTVPAGPELQGLGVRGEAPNDVVAGVVVVEHVHPRGLELLGDGEAGGGGRASKRLGLGAGAGGVQTEASTSAGADAAAFQILRTTLEGVG